MKYLALLRGINVGGNNPIKMVDLKKAFEAAGFTHVITYINSGNVIFESDETDVQAITRVLEEALTQTFHYEARLVIRSHEQFKDVISGIPREWKTQKDLRCYIAFIKEPVTSGDVLQEIQLKEGIDFVKEGQQVVYMTTLLSGLTKSGFTKLIGKKIFQNLTIRNFNTSQKLLALMDKN